MQRPSRAHQPYADGNAPVLCGSAPEKLVRVRTSVAFSYNITKGRSKVTTHVNLVLSRYPRTLTLNHSARRKLAPTQDERENYALRLDLEIEKEAT